MKAHEKFTGRESTVPGHVSLSLSFGFQHLYVILGYLGE